MKETLAQVNRLIESIDSAKPEEARLEGEKKILLQNLQSEFDIKTFKGGQELMRTEKESLAEKKERVRARFSKLKERYQW